MTPAEACVVERDSGTYYQMKVIDALIDLVYAGHKNVEQITARLNDRGFKVMPKDVATLVRDLWDQEWYRENCTVLGTVTTFLVKPL